MDTAEEKVISEESVAGGIFREILYLLLKIVAIATAIVWLSSHLSSGCSAMRTTPCFRQ